MRFRDYPPRMMEHFTHPRNVGVLENPSAVGRARNDACGDAMELHLRVREGVVADARFKTLGCTAAIAASSALTELLEQKSLDAARSLRHAQLDEALGGLPPVKRHALDLALDALADALASIRP